MEYNNATSLALFEPAGEYNPVDRERERKTGLCLIRLPCLYPGRLALNKKGGKFTRPGLSGAEFDSVSFSPGA